VSFGIDLTRGKKRGTLPTQKEERGGSFKTEKLMTFVKPSHEGPYPSSLNQEAGQAPKEGGESAGGTK